ncbi:MAG: SDR family NAD(P)-dependent oxidoreductase [Candidatus Marinimicrobia bacterium]|nr:SDR family NAD(P)-dependent oxidoreductase [Candidatus Neomarinimicrobiota bacterium]
MNKIVFITGASSGIGEYVAYEYAKQGATIGLAARRNDLLETISTKCKELGGKPIIYKCDVSDQSAIKKAIDNFIIKSGGIDIVIANAGISGKVKLANGNSDEINRMLSINILGVTNTILPALPTMIKQKSGRIVVLSSIAGFRGLPGRSSYSASKVAVRFMANSWRSSFVNDGISFTTICPGFVDTEMTNKHKYHMPFLMNVDVFAQKMVKAIENKKKTYVAPWQWRLIIPLIKIVPEWFINFVASKKV